MVRHTLASVALAVAAADTTRANHSTSQSLLPKVHGVNYGSRFIVEKFFGLWGTDDMLFKDISSGQPGADASLCDVGTASDAGTRMSTFLDGNIKEEHFQKMASLGFNTVRLPLGYWNLIDLPGGAAPNGPDDVADRWRRLQSILPASAYRKWIDQVFDYAASHGLTVMLDLHGAPGAQAGNAFSGCDIGGDSVYYWDTEWNKQLSVQAVEAMAKICAEKGSTCWGLELLNEPFGYNHQGLSRDSLKDFYVDAIGAARNHIAMEVPVMIMDWPDWLASYWRSAAPATFSEAQHGKVVFSTHMYQWPNPAETDLVNAERLFDGNFKDAESFTSASGFELIFSEWAMNSHGSGGSDDNFDYDGYARWFVQQGDSKGAGSCVWNFDSFYAAWGPVNQPQVGNSLVDWKGIFATAKVLV